MLIPNKHSGYMRDGMRLYPGGSKGGGSSAAAPDPRLIEAQIRSMGIQDNSIQKMLTNSEAMIPLQREQMQFGLDTARSAYGQSQEDRSWMLGRRGSLGGLQDRMVADAASYNEGDRATQMRGEAFADVNQGFSSSREQGMRAMGRMGINPNSGRMLAMNNQMSIAQASAMANAGNKVNAAARAEGFAMTDRATNALAGYPAMSMQATGAGAGFGASGLNMANMGLSGMNSGFGAAGQVAGQMGQNASSMYGAMGNYKNAQDKMAAENDPMNVIFGAAAGAGMKALMSDRRLKTNITLVGTDERTGLNIYDFEYIAMRGKLWQGVMADEVEKVIPEAVHYGSDGFASVDYGMLGFEMLCLGETK